MSPFDALVHYNTACCNALLGHATDAMGHLKMAVDCGFSSVKSLKEDSDLESVRALPEFQALIADIQGKREHAKRGPEQLSSRDQDKIDELTMKAEIKLRASEFATAVALLKQARSLCPRHKIIHYNLACAYSLMNRRSLALESLEQVRWGPGRGSGHGSCDVGNHASCVSSGRVCVAPGKACR